MAHEACTGIGGQAWRNSVLVSSTGNVEQDGRLDVEVDNETTGTLKGRHVNTGQTLSGDCRAGAGVLRIITLTRSGGGATVTYTGMSAPTGTGHTIVRGTYIKVTVNALNALATETGDWSAEKPGD